VEGPSAWVVIASKSPPSDVLSFFIHSTRSKQKPPCRARTGMLAVFGAGHNIVYQPYEYRFHIISLKPALKRTNNSIIGTPEKNFIKELNIIQLSCFIRLIY
jgi:hypothetical protein